MNPRHAALMLTMERGDDSSKVTDETTARLRDYDTGESVRRDVSKTDLPERFSFAYHILGNRNPMLSKSCRRSATDPKCSSGKLMFVKD